MHTKLHRALIPHSLPIRTIRTRNSQRTPRLNSNPPNIDPIILDRTLQLRPSPPSALLIHRDRQASQHLDNRAHLQLVLIIDRRDLDEEALVDIIAPRDLRRRRLGIPVRGQGQEVDDRVQEGEVGELHPARGVVEADVEATAFEPGRCIVTSSRGYPRRINLIRERHLLRRCGRGRQIPPPILQRTPHRPKPQRRPLNPRHKARTRIQTAPIILLEQLLQRPHQTLRLKSRGIHRSHHFQGDVVRHGERDRSGDLEVPGVQRDVHEIGHDGEPDVGFA